MIERKRYLDKITPFIEKPVIKVITGIRRCGKSTLLKQIIQLVENRNVAIEQIIHINMELMEFDGLKNYRDLYTYIQERQKKIGVKYYIFIDEVQEIEEWEKAINSLLAEGKSDIYISGSNARLLSSELATLLSGRYVEFKMYSLVFSEFISFINSKDRGNTIEKQFDAFLKFGGFPGIHHMELDDTVIRQYLQSIYNSVLLKDVIVRNNIRDAAMLDVISKYLIDNSGKITSAKSISDFMKSQNRKGSVDTVLNYIRFNCDALLFEKVERYDLKGKRLLETYEKYYMSDIGLRFATLGYTPESVSAQLENIVYLELKSRDYKITIGKLDDLEIDFIATKGTEKIYIQVSTQLTNNKVIEREYRSLEMVKDSFPKYVLSLDKGFETSRNGIRWMNIVDFLLS
ncbi:MAG: ATP-binding protein, partial [Crocinitomicaceae bacterium]|nr:ATP-binding protein [Crocinitomicaceae bacterium]